MDKQKEVIIIGAGVGGLSTAIYLAKNGFKVTVFEKNANAGGRCGNFTKDGHRFDIGATLLMMPDIYRRTFADMGKKLEEELELLRLDPIYRIKFPDKGELFFSSDLAQMQQQLESIEPGSFTRFLKYMQKSFKAYKISMKAIIERNYYNLFNFFNLKNFLILIKVKAFQNHNRLTSKYFKNEILRAAFTFQNIYVGQNPFKASAVFSMLPFLELADGVWFPKGGMYQVVDRFLAIAAENQVKIRYKSNVKAISVEGKKIRGVVLSDDSFHPADLVVTNADLPYAYKELLPEADYMSRLKRLQYTCSAIMLHWGTDCEFPELEQHNVFVSRNYRKSIRSIFNGGVGLDDPSFYVHSPVKTDPSAAPEGQDSLSIIVPVPHTKNATDSDLENIKLIARDAVINRLKEEGFADIEKHIKFERCYTQRTWENLYNLTYGATFGSLSHNLFQMGYMRPHNQHRKYKNLFFVGGSTHPGNGVPMSLISARLTTERILRYYNQKTN